MAHISINKQYIVAGESFILTLDDYQGEIGTQHTYAISGPGRNSPSIKTTYTHWC